MVMKSKKDTLNNIDDLAFFSLKIIKIFNHLT